MASPITKKILKHVAGLARIELTVREEDKLAKELQKVVGHFEELQELATDDVPPMAGGGSIVNSFRKDGDHADSQSKFGADALPENENGFLRVPPVFER